MAEGAGKKIKLRTLIISLGLILLLGWVIGNLVYRALVTGDELKAKAADQQLLDVTIPANRGTIYDCNMNVLAQSATVWDVVIAPREVYSDINKLKKASDRTDYEDRFVQKLAEILEVEEDAIREHLTHSDSMYRVVKRKVVKSVADAVTALAAGEDFAGIYLYENTKRFYPYNSLASSVIGFTNYDNVGIYGIEATYNDVLSGTDGRQISAKNALGEALSTTYEKVYPATDGNSLVLTIDQVVQHYLEKTLTATIAQHNPTEGAAGIVMDVKTGAILAMSSMPDYDLNDPLTVYDSDLAAQIAAITDEEEQAAAKKTAQEKQWRNKTVSDIYEPGSVFKVVTASAALEEGTATVNSTFTCTGSVILPGWPKPIHCHNHAGHGTLNFVEAIVASCNPAFMSIGASLGAERFYKYFDAFGLTEKTGIDLPAEAQNTFYTADNMTSINLASCSFGQSNTVTPIQMLTAAVAAINGGYLLQPHIVEKIVDTNLNTIEEFGTEVKRQVISGETSAIMRDALEQVVSANGGTNAYVKGYRIGGKSGTAEKLNKADEDVYIFSFFAFAPADDPQVAALILVDEATSGAQYANTVVAPAAAALMADLLPYIGVQAQYDESDVQNAVVPSSLVGSDPLAAASALRIEGLEGTIVGQGKTVVSVYPKSGTTVAAGSTIFLYTEEDGEETTIVPDVIGLTPAQANTKLVNAGLNIVVSGGAAQNAQARVTSQDIAEGTEVLKGTVVTIECLVTGEDGD